MPRIVPVSFDNLAFPVPLDAIEETQGSLQRQGTLTLCTTFAALGTCGSGNQCQRGHVRGAAEIFRRPGVSTLEQEQLFMRALQLAIAQFGYGYVPNNLPSITLLPNNLPIITLKGHGRFHKDNKTWTSHQASAKFVVKLRRDGGGHRAYLIDTYGQAPLNGSPTDCAYPSFDRDELDALKERAIAICLRSQARSTDLKHKQSRCEHCQELGRNCTGR